MQLVGASDQHLLHIQQGVEVCSALSLQFGGAAEGRGDGTVS